MGRRNKTRNNILQTQHSGENNLFPATTPPVWQMNNLSAANLISQQQDGNQFGSSPPFRPDVQLPHSSQLVLHNGWASTTALNSLTSSNQHSAASNGYLSTRDAVGDQLSEVLSLIDEDTYTGTDREIILTIPSSPPPSYHRTGSLPLPQLEGTERRLPLVQTSSTRPQQSRDRRINLVAKVSYYGNSRLPPHLPPFRAYISTYPLLCLAALCSANAYNRHQTTVQNEQLISADTRIGSKAMVVKSVTCANDKTLVFAIRGTSVLSLRDWNVNLHTAPESPTAFLDDDGNYCHSGFLNVARAMVQPIAARLRTLLEENPSRTAYSLLFTGHSAGGAVASLLYTHMLSQTVTSDLTNLADCFRRIHCVTFGAPPISLLPLTKPDTARHKRSCFFSLVNEGDPVVRAEKSYIMSLVDLLTTAPIPSIRTALPDPANPATPATTTQPPTKSSSLHKVTNLGFFTKRPKPKPNVKPNLPPSPTTAPLWQVPQATLSNAGRLIVLRGLTTAPAAASGTGTGIGTTTASTSGPGAVDLTHEFSSVRAYTVTDEELRKVIFGDPLMHGMDVYRRRVEALAMKAVTGREGYY